MSGVVQRFTARLRVGRRAQATEAQAILRAFARDRLPDLVAAAAGDATLVVDRLHIDLGRVRAADLPARLDAAIVSAVAAALRREPGAAAETEARGEASGENLLEALRLRLETGRAHRRGERQDLEALLVAAMQAQPAATEALLQALAATPAAAERLHRQLSPAAWEALKSRLRGSAAASRLERRGSEGWPDARPGESRATGGEPPRDVSSALPEAPEPAELAAALARRTAAEGGAELDAVAQDASEAARAGRLCACGGPAAAAAVAAALTQALDGGRRSAQSALAEALTAAAAELGEASSRLTAALLAQERRDGLETPAAAAFADMLATLAADAPPAARRAPQPALLAYLRYGRAEADPRTLAAQARNAQMRPAAARLAAVSPAARIRLERLAGPALRAVAAPPISPLEDDLTDTAGLVLLWPFLQRHFSACGLLADDAFADAAAQRRAALLLHRLAAGTAEAPEHRLLLEKTLCGLGPAQPTDLAILPAADEIAAGETLLSAVRGHWPGLAGSSDEALRVTFLAREGRLVRAHAQGALTLEVAPGPYDMLLDRIPWPLSVVRLPWMQEALFVRWR